MESQEKKVHPIMISAEVMGMKGLSFIQKGFIAEIQHLDNANGCYANNAHFASRFDLSKDRVSEVISYLHELGIISVEINKKAKNQRTIKIKDLSVEIPIGEKAYRRKRLTPIGENTNTLSVETPNPIGENTEHKEQLNNKEKVQGIESTDTPQTFSPSSEIIESPSGETKDKTTSTNRKKESNTQKNAGAAEIVLPFASEAFAEVWGEYLEMRKEEDYSCKHNHKKTMLRRLSEYDEGFAIMLLKNGKDNRWQGLFFDNTERKYREYLRDKERFENLFTPRLPFDSTEFSLKWGMWKFHLKRLGRSYESNMQEDLILKELGEFDEEYAMNLIQSAIIGGKWTLIWPDTKEKYQQHLKEKKVQQAKKPLTRADVDKMFGGPQVVRSNG